MAQPVEPMDIDCSVCEFDNKENTFHHNNVAPGTPCTEKGYEELDVSELNMKLRYSVTPASSPMSKSFTASCLDNRNLESDSMQNCENGNMTRSLHSTLKNESTAKVPKVLPLQVLSTDQGQIMDGNRNALRPIDTTATLTGNNVTVTISEPNDIGENISLPSSSSSLAHTPEATTPTKELPKGDASPIMRGLKSVLNMFRPSQSPIPLEDETKQEALSPPIVISPETSERSKSQVISVSTPLAAQKTKDPLAKKSSPNRDSLVFSEDLETELQWKEDSEIIFSKEKVPLHKLFFTLPKTGEDTTEIPKTVVKNDANENLDAMVEFMDVSYNDMPDKTITTSETLNKSEMNAESDNEFLDCESTFNKSESLLEESFKSQEEYTSVCKDGKENVRTTENLNDTTETLNNLSDASTATATANNSLASASKMETLVNISTAELNKSKEIEETVTPAQKNIEAITQDSPKEEKENKIVSTPVTDTENIKPVSKTSASNISIPENVISSLARIPLIVDPKVLLFNIPSDTVVDKECKDVSAELDTTPADIPLPDDEDIDNMPSITTAVVSGDDLKNIVDNKADVIELRAPLDQVNTATTKSVEENGEKDDVANNEGPSNSTVLIENNMPELISNISHIQDINMTLNESTILSKTLSHNETILRSIDDLINEIDFNKSPVMKTIEEDVPPQTAEPMDISMAEVHIDVVDKVRVVTETIKDAANRETEVIPQPEIETVTDTMIPIVQKEELDNKIAVVKNATETSLEVVIPQQPIIKTETDTIPTVQQEASDNKIATVENGTESPLEAIIPQKPIIETETDIKSPIILQEEKDHNMASVVSATANPLEVVKPTSTIENASDIPLEVVRPTSTTKVEPLVSTEAAESEMVRKIGSDIESIKYEVEAIVATAMDIVAFKETEMKTEINTSEDSSGVGKQSEAPTDTLKPEESQNISSEATESSVSIVVDQKVTTPISDKVKVDQFIESTLKDAETVEQIIVIETDVANLQPLTESIAVPEEEEENVLDSVHVVPKIFDDSDELEEPVKTVAQNESAEIPEAPVVGESPVLQEPQQTSEIKHEINPVEQIKEDQTTVGPETPQKLAVNTENIDEEIVASENGSPFVSVSTEVESLEEIQSENFEEIENPFATKSKVTVSPPLSPKIVSKGYNFNFDEIDDPFATKTKIRQSPPPGESPNHSFEEIDIKREMPKKEFNKNNKRKSQPQGKKPTHNKKLNSTFAGKSNVNKASTSKLEVQAPFGNAESAEDQLVVKKEIPTDIQDETMVIDKENKPKEIAAKRTVPSDITQKELVIEIPVKSVEEVKDEFIKDASSSEQSAYCSAVASSNESIKAKNAFNLPELDDPNFNPFATKTKMRQSPPPCAEIDPFATKSKIPQSPPPGVDAIDPFATKCKMAASPVSSMIAEQITEMQNADVTMTIEAASAMDEVIETQASDLTMTIEVSNKLSSVANETFNKQKGGTQAFDVTMTVETDNKLSSKEADEEIPEAADMTMTVAIEKETENNVTLNNTSSTVKTDEADTLEGPFLEAEDFADDKMSDFDGDNVDMMQFSELPPNIEAHEGGEMFIDAEAFEFLLNQNQASTVADCGKESLFLKFDPLFAKRMSSDGVKNIQPRESTPKKVASLIDTTFEKSPIAGPSNINATQDIDKTATDDSCDDLNVTVTKPMMVVNPAVNPGVSPRNKSLTPARTNRQSLTFTSPAIAVIDRLLNMSAHNSLVSQNSTITEVRRDNEADLALTQLRELLADKEISVYNLRSESKELKDRLANLESQMRSLEAVSAEPMKKINELNEKLNEKTKANRSMAKVVEEYERTIASLITETEQDRNRHAEERLQLIKERDEQTAHLASMEVSFSDLHSKYEKTKQIILGFKAADESYRKSIKESEENIEKLDKNYELLKQHATAKLTHANEELQKINRAHESEVLKLKALIKRKELHITSLEESLQQKTKANDELTAICDELINRVG